MTQHDDDGPVVRYMIEFFDWLSEYIVLIEDFPYAGIDYRVDPHIPLLAEAQWDDVGNIFSFWHIFEFFYFLSVFFFQRLIVRTLCVDVGRTHQT